MRIRIALGVLVAAIVVAAAAVALTRGSGAQPPAAGAAALVPGDALAFIDVSTDPSRPAVKGALQLGTRFPTYPLIAAGVIARLSAIVGGGSHADYSRDIRPWLGKEVALALLNTTTAAAGSELVLDVSSMAAARAFIARAGASADGSYSGTTLYRYRSQSVLAFVRHYLVIGQSSSVRAAIDSASGRLPSLQASSTYQRAAAGEPPDRVLDAYVSAAGIGRLLIPHGKLIGALGTLLDEPDVTGMTISLSADGGYAKLHLHSALNPALASLNPARAFTPTLTQLLPAGSLMLLDVRGLDRIAPHILNAGAVGGIASQVGPLLSRLGGALTAEGVDVHQIESLFSGETAVAIGPSRALIIVTRTADVQATRTELANLEVPLSQLFPPPASGSGQVPQFNDQTVDGVSAHQLLLAPGLELAYAVFRGLVVVSTSLQGIGEVAGHLRSLATEAAYRGTLAGRPDEVSSLVFLDFSQLLSLAEQTGLLQGARYRALAPDIKRIRAAGLDSTRGKSDSTANIIIQIS